MERHHIFEAKSIFSYMQAQKFNKIENLKSVQICEELYLNAEVLKMKDRVNELQKKIGYESEEIGDVLKDLEFYLPVGNNNKKLNQFFYTSKLFLSIVECLNYANQKFISKLLFFIEKMLKGNRNISKYLSLNHNFIKMILTFMKMDGLFDICIKISEELFMNSAKLIPIAQFYRQIEDNYLLIENNSLHTFCRILAIMIFDHKKMEFKQLFKYKENLKIRAVPKVTTENQSICYHLPRFLHNLVISLKNKFNQTISTANQIPLIYSLLHNNTINENDNENESNEFDSLLAGPNNLNYLSSEPGRRNENRLEIYSLLNAEKETLHIFNSLRKTELMNVLYANVFSNFVPDWNYFTLRTNSNPQGRDNIFNLYTKMMKIFKKIKNKGRIKDTNKNYINVLKYSTCQIEMLFVLSTLVGCKRKCEIQDKLSNYDIIDTLNEYLEYIEWGNIFNENNRPYFDVNGVNFNDDTSYHGRGCKCDSDTALKIQFLRFIYTYCCRDKANVKNKLEMISISDLQNLLSPSYMTLFYFYLMKNYDKLKDNPESKFNKIFYRYAKILQDNFFKYFVCNSANNYNNGQFLEFNQHIQKIVLNQISLESLSKHVEYMNNNYDKIGLLNKLILKYIQECSYSSSKFWLASCIEVMVRGNNTFFQYTIANTGLIPYLLYDIIYGRSNQAQIIQLSFDILGELIKFNKANFLLLNYYFVDNNEFKAFCKKVIEPTSLIDSNVFLRSIIISIDFFDKEDAKLNIKKEKNEFFSQNCKFCNFISNTIHSIFNALIKVVKPDDINQTNISCINTALLIIILEYNNNKLGEFLQLIRQQFEDAKENLENFKNLISIWKDFYNYRPKDSASLQHSTLINFNVWQTVTSILIEKNENKVESLFYKYD